MSECAHLNAIVYTSATTEQAAILAVLESHGLGLDLDPQIADGELAFGDRYWTAQSSMGTVRGASNLAADLMKAAPSAAFEVWLAPFEQDAGHYVGHAPGVGTVDAECNASGGPFIPLSRLHEELDALPAGTTVERWLADRGAALLGTAVLPVLRAHACPN